MQEAEDSLIACARAGEGEEVANLLKNNKSLNINCVDDRGRSSLHMTSANGFESLTEYLLQQPHIDLNIQSDTGDAPLHWAVMNGHSKIVRILLQNGANVNLANNKNETAMNVAIRFSRRNIATLLHENGGCVTSVLTSSKKAKIIVCANCSKQEDASSLRFRACSRCKKISKTIKYCTLQCQKQDWPNHRLVCGKP
eukprot:TRINITY_DN22107_c0_g1_i1.p1 TRINITY_DN22107_c0_g1~~TRINITY_DN22107_c0_g1_i1.p1  ORF type:complete len:197 (+),score=23.46 TRINITY_DN22107_c0_g1_i1:20-610(+)